MPFPSFFWGGTPGEYWFWALAPLALVWTVAWAGTASGRSALRGWQGAATLDTLLRPVPVIGRRWRDLEHWRVVSGMEMMTNAGIGVGAALRECADFCLSPRLAAHFSECCELRRKELARWTPRIAYALVCIYLVLQIFKLADQSVQIINSVMERTDDAAAALC